MSSTPYHFAEDFSSSLSISNDRQAITKATSILSYTFLSDKEFVIAFPELIEEHFTEPQRRHIKGFEYLPDGNQTEVAPEAATIQQRCNYIRHLQHRTASAIARMIVHNENYRSPLQNNPELSRLFEAAMNVIIHCKI